MNDVELGTLAQSAQHGSVNAFCDIVLATQESVRLQIARLGVRGAAIDTIAQDVYITAWRRLDSFDAERQVLPWLFGIVRNLVRKHFSREARRHEVEITAQLERCADETSLKAPPVDLLRLCIDTLTERAKRIIHLHYFNEQTSAEIGTALGLEATAVRMVLQRARVALQTCVERRLAEEARP